MNIDFVKWMIEHADGFEEKGFGGIIGYYKYGCYRFKDVQNWYLYPLLLQRAIEGVKCAVSICASGYIEIGDPDDPYMLRVSDFKNIDKAKEAALKNIWEQENETL